MNALTLTDWIGTVGVAILLLAFALNLLNKIRRDSYPYLIMNILGASLACLASVMLNFIPFIVLEGVWALVSLIALIRKIKTY